MTPPRAKPVYDSGYLSREVVRIVGITYRQLDYWDRSGFIRPSIQPTRGRGKARIYSEEDLVALRIAKRMKQERLSLAKMRRALSYLKRALSSSQRSLAAATFLTDGKKVFHLTANPGVVVDVTSRGQLVFAFALHNFLRGGRASSSRSMHKREPVSVSS